jgi:aryl-alcohol dehydrogenase-like predicted oxidoreductase
LIHAVDPLNQEFIMDITRTAYGMWNGGRFMHYGEPLDDERLLSAIRHAWERGIRTFLTADVYGNGAADDMLGRALSGFPRDSYCLVGTVGHDFYKGQRQGAKGYPRFTDPTLRSAREFDAYLRMATEKSLERCRTDHFDCLLLHNPDATGYGSDAVWKGMERLRETRLTRLLGIAPGPANGFTLDIILNFERFGALVDWAMIILNPLEPWPGALCLPAAEKYGVDVITRVVDYGGLFHDDVKPGHAFGKQDHRAFRPAGWVEAGFEKIEKLRPIAERHGLTLLQFACIWNLSHRPVRSVVPTLIQETGPDAKPIEEKIDELAALPEIELSEDEREEVRRIGDNRGCMELKGANPAHTGEPLADRWAVSNDLAQIAQRWRIDPACDLAYTHAVSAPS